MSWRPDREADKARAATAAPTAGHTNHRIFAVVQAGMNAITVVILWCIILAGPPLIVLRRRATRTSDSLAFGERLWLAQAAVYVPLGLTALILPLRYLAAAVALAAIHVFAVCGIVHTARWFAAGKSDRAIVDVVGALAGIVVCAAYYYEVLRNGPIV